MGNPIFDPYEAERDFEIMNEQLERLDELIDLEMEMQKYPTLRTLILNNLVPEGVTTGEKMFEWLTNVLIVYSDLPSP